MLSGVLGAVDLVRRVTRAFPHARVATKPVACPICLETVPPTHAVVMDACTHAFCLACMTDWCLTSMREGRTTRCPMCRAAASPEPVPR